MINNPSYINRCNKTNNSTFNNVDRERDFREKEDAELLLLAQQGEAEAFSELYIRFAPPIFRFLFSHLDDRLDAEDLTEEVFLRLWRFLPQYQEQGVPILAFLFKIARNALIDFIEDPVRAGDMSIEENPIPAIQFDPGSCINLPGTPGSSPDAGTNCLKITDGPGIAVPERIIAGRNRRSHGAHPRRCPHPATQGAIGLAQLARDLTKHGHQHYASS
jgi:hypothetical protein